MYLIRGFRTGFRKIIKNFFHPLKAKLEIIYLFNGYTLNFIIEIFKKNMFTVNGITILPFEYVLHYFQWASHSLTSVTFTFIHHNSKKVSVMTNWISNILRTRLNSSVNFKILFIIKISYSFNKHSTNSCTIWSGLPVRSKRLINSPKLVQGNDILKTKKIQ